ncbi:MAG: molybdopterin guanine dinucleotide synthesis [Pararhodobacter sp.]|nr:molybdopterin guanine dinucleotide synthesis [Pararhodobacter sp.]
MTFARIAILDWSAAATPCRGADSIWLGMAAQGRIHSRNLPTRQRAEALLIRLVRACRARGDRLLIGADFAFGYPAGFARALTGQADALAVWGWLAAHIRDDARNRNNRFTVAAAMNRALPGLGPFWFRPAALALPDLPARGSARHGNQMLADLRATDRASPGAQSVWKLGGAGAVGSQGLMGLPMLWRLRAAFPDAVAVWPFDAHWATAPVVLAEVFPSMLNAEIAALRQPHLTGRRPTRRAWPVKDAVQVRLLAAALDRLSMAGRLVPLMAALPDDPVIRTEEGWILGAGSPAFGAALRDAAQESGAAALPLNPALCRPFRSR